MTGELYNDTVDRLPELEEIYAAASKDTSGRTIVKAVNLTGDDREVYIDIEGTEKKKVTIHSLSDCALSAENTFEQSDRIRPETVESALAENEYVLKVKPHSVNVLVFE